MPAKKKKPLLPPYVVLKKGSEWHVRIAFPTGNRNAKGKIIYEQMTRICEPRTWDRAAHIVLELRRMNTAVRNSVEVSPAATQTVADLLEHYLSVKKQSVSERTHDYYTHLFEKHIKPGSVAGLVPANLTSLDVQRFYDSLLASGSSASMIKKINVLLSMAFKQGVRWGKMASNPCDGVMLPKVRRVESLAMSANEIKRFLAAARKDDRFIIFEFALETGLRPQEVLGLAWDCVDLKARKIIVKQAWIEDFKGAGGKLGDLKTLASARTIGISQYIADRLKRQREILNEIIEAAEADAAGKALLARKRATGPRYKRRLKHRQVSRERAAEMKRFNLVFPAENGRPKSTKNIGKRDFKEILRLAGIDQDKYSFRNLRHTCLTMLADHLHPKKLQKYAGHADLSTTNNFYVHVDDDAQFEASGQMDRLLRADQV